LILAIGLAWFAFASYQRTRAAERELLALKDELRVLERALAAAEQGLRTLSAHPSVPRDVALTADMTLDDVRRIARRKELDD
jgi:cell division protein FtsB